jgi:hypothetical protein
MGSRTTNTTGIGVRSGTAQLGGVSTQPIPFVLPATHPVTRQTNPTTSIVAPNDIAEALTSGRPPELVISVRDVINGTMDSAVRELLPARLTAVQYQPTTEPAALRPSSSTLTTQRRPNEETLSLAHLGISNGEFQPVDPHGISKLRPEIISLMDYKPIYFGNSLTLNDVGVLMDVQYQARQLREQTFFQLMRGIQQADQSQQLQNIQNEFTTNFQRINSSAEFYRNTIIALETAKNGFDLKTIPGNSFDLENFKTLRDFYESFMLFPRDAIDRFSGTKIIMQLLFDMRSIAEGYSMNLLNLTDPDRQTGGVAFTSPTTIDKSYNNRNGFSFTYDTIRSYTDPVNAADNQFFTRFNASLPQQPDDRIKILVNMISKELRVSRGLGREVVASGLRQKFGATIIDGSPFDNLIGGVGDTIFDSITGPGSLASLTILNNVAGSAVLPFETKYIDVNNTRKVYIPGSSFFIDSIINVPVLTSFNLTPFRTYVENFVRTTDDVASIVVNLFDYGEEISSLCPTELFKQLLDGVSHGLMFLMSNPQRNGLQINIADAASAAIFRLAVTDPLLKAMLFQYVLLNLLASSNSRFFADKVAEELLNDIRNLNAVTVNANYPLPDLRTPNSLQPFINILGVTIQDRVVRLVNQQAITQYPNNAQATDRAGTLTDGRMRVGFDVDSTYGIPTALNQSHFLTNLTGFIVGLETILGNETNNILDNTKRSRFNSISMSTIVLMAFEAYANLISRYVKVDFQISGFGRNFPDMIVDTNFNAQMQSSIEELLSDPGLALPVIPPETATDVTKPNGTRVPNTQRFPRNHRVSSFRHAYEQANDTAQLIGTTPSDVHDGIIQNEAILGGPRATTSSRFADASQFAMRKVNRHTNPSDLIDAHALDRSLDSIAFKLFQEDFSIACAMHILLVIKQRLRTTLDVATNYFTQQTLTNFATSSGTSLSDIGKNLFPSQVRLLLRQRDSYIKSLTSNSNQIQFIPVSSTDVNVRNVIRSLLDKAPYRESTDAGLRYRLLTVGIPSGFSKNLADRLVGTNLSSTNFQRNKNFDLVYINVYKRNLEFPQVIFKPRKFLFDLSLFPNGYSDLDIRSSENFDSVLQRITLFDYQNFTNPTTVTMENIIDNDKYSLVSNPNQRRAMFENHVLSDVFGSYIQALTTMKLAESTFVNTDSETWKRLSIGRNGTDLTPRFAELVRQYLIAQRTQEIRNNPSLRPLPDISIQEMLTNSGVDQGTKDTLRLLTFGNIAFKPENAMAEMLSPKVFERVFTIPLNVDDFDIDREATTGSESGREFFEKSFFRKKLDTHTPVGVYRFKPRTHQDVVFEDYFITIELVE